MNIASVLEFGSESRAQALIQDNESDIMLIFNLGV